MSSNPRLRSVAEPDLTGNEAAYLAQCVSSGFVSSVGPFVNRFEDLVADATGAEGCTAVASGSAALYLALRVAGVRAGDLVITSSYSFIATANAIRLAGAEPWLFDIEPEGWTLNPGLLRTRLERDTVRRGADLLHVESGARVAAVLPVYTLGNTPLVEPIRAIAREHGLPVIGDAAAAIGARHRNVSLAETADLVCLSFNGNKTITSGGGGAIVGMNAGAIEHAKHLSTQARRGPGYDHDEAGFNFRMTNVQAAVGCAQMERLDAFLAAKRRIAAGYRGACDTVDGLNALPSPPWCESAAWLSGVLTDDADAAGGLCAAMASRGVAARPFWKPLHLQRPYRACSRTDMTVCEAIWERVVTLPSSVTMEEADITEVSRSLTSAMRSPAVRVA
jgi:dTDP-4-amino-4,6-dideoxygalactose transaminase